MHSFWDPECCTQRKLLNYFIFCEIKIAPEFLRKAVKALTYKKSYRPIFINQLFLNIFRCFFHYQYEHHVVLLISSLAQWFGRYGSIHPEVFCKKVFKGFTKVARKHRCQSLFFKKSCRPPACSFINKEVLGLVFSCDFCEIFQNTFF